MMVTNSANHNHVNDLAGFRNLQFPRHQITSDYNTAFYISVSNIYPPPSPIETHNMYEPLMITTKFGGIKKNYTWFHLCMGGSKWLLT